MSTEDKLKLKYAYIDAVNETGLPRSILKDLHKINDNTLDKWLYVSDRYPSFRALYELWSFLKKSSFNVPCGINDFFTKMNNSSLELANSYAPKKTKKRKTNVYILNGQSVTADEAWSPLNFPNKTALKNCIRARKIHNGDDISELVAGKGRGRPAGINKYLCKGVEVTIEDAWETLCFSSAASLKSSIHRYGIKPGEELPRVKKRPKNKYIYNGKNISLRDACTIFGYQSTTALTAVFYIRGVKHGDDITNFKTSHSRKAKMYRLNDRPVTASEAYRELGYISSRSLRTKLTQLGVADGDDISHVRKKK